MLRNMQFLEHNDMKAFGTHLRLPDPTQFAADSDFTLRIGISPEGALGAYASGRLVGFAGSQK
jgi:hypothetical protein